MMDNSQAKRISKRILRDLYRATSNNLKNPNKNICAKAVASAFGRADSKVRYLHTSEDVVRAVRKNGFIVSKQKGTKGQAVCQIDHENTDGLVGWIVEVDGHILALSPDGQGGVDTDPPKKGWADIRPIKNLWAVL